MNSQGDAKAAEALAFAFARTTHDIELFVRDQMETCDSDWQERLRAHILKRVRLHVDSALHRVLETQGNRQIHIVATAFSNSFANTLNDLDRSEKHR